MKIVLTKTKTADPIAEERDDEFRIFRNRKELHSGGVAPWFVYINDYAWEAFLSHTEGIYARTGHEGQGIFGGKYFKDELGEFAVATTYYEGEGSSTHSHVEMSEECLSSISQHCLDENLLMLIWVHTHPTFGPFYSGTDSSCLRTNFFMPFQIGIVVDIVNRTLKAFRVASREVVEFNDYALYNDERMDLFRPYQRKDIDIEVKKKTSEPVAVLPESVLWELKYINETLEAIRRVATDHIQEQRVSSSGATDLISSELFGSLEKTQTEIKAIRHLLEAVNESFGKIVSVTDSSREKKDKRRTVTIVSIIGVTIIGVPILILVVLLVLKQLFWR